jgi:hypothetical protein
MYGSLPFTFEMLAAVPQVTGTYFVFRLDEPLYVGVAAGGANLRSELVRHLARELGIPTRHATHFWWHATDDVMEAYRLQLAAHAVWDLRRAPAPDACRQAA